MELTARGARYLIVRLSALGDVVMASTLIGAIRARDPGAHITWLCGGGVAPLVRLFDGVDEVLAIDEVALLRGGMAPRLRTVVSLWGTLASRRFDMTLLGHADARYRVALRPARLGEVRTLEPLSGLRMLPIPGRYFADEYVRMLDAPGSRGPITGHAELALLRAKLPTPPAPDRVGVVLVPGGTRNVLRESGLRRWPVARYAEVAAGLLAAGRPVTLVGDAGDAWTRPAFAGLDVRDEIGAHSVEGTLALMASAQLVISHDTGPLHLAGLVRVPLLGLFGPTMPTQFMPRHAGAEACWGGAGLGCRPCYDGRELAACVNNLCMQDIAAATVLVRALRMGEGASAPAPPTTILRS